VTGLSGSRLPVRSRFHPRDELFLSTNHLLPLLPGLTAPLLVSMGELWVSMKKATKDAADWREDQRQKQHAHDEKRNLRHDRDHHADDAEHEKEDGPGQILGPAAPSASTSLRTPHSLPLFPERVPRRAYIRSDINRRRRLSERRAGSLRRGRLRSRRRMRAGLDQRRRSFLRQDCVVKLTLSAICSFRRPLQVQGTKGFGQNSLLGSQLAEKDHGALK
jgi:hypothetical protein